MSNSPLNGTSYTRPTMQRMRRIVEGRMAYQSFLGRMVEVVSVTMNVMWTDVEPGRSC